MPANDDKALDQVISAFEASRGPQPANRKPITMEEFQKVIDSTPLFMRETPASAEGNYVLEALQSLVFDGEGDDIALNFKNHGNELYAQKSYRDAITAYTQGLDAGVQDDSLRISLLNNRAAANIALQNYGAALKDTSVILALSAKRGEDPPAKAMYRAAQSLVALSKWDEARDCVERGKKIKGEEEHQSVWEALEEKIEKGQRAVEERKERERRDKIGKEALRRAVESRGLIVINTSEPPDNPEPLHFDSDNLPPTPPLYTLPTPGQTPTKWYPPPVDHPLIFPVFLLYPQHNMSDLITRFHEDTSFEDQLAAIFPSDPNAPSSVSSSSSPPWPDWDTKHEYYTSNLVVYAETADQRLLKIGKELTLREVFRKANREAKDNVSKDGIVLRDGLLSFVVLVKGKEEKEWIENYKRKRDEGKR